jgi:hypothetical protein
MPSKLYVGNLAYSASNSDLEHLASGASKLSSEAHATRFHVRVSIHAQNNN